MNFFVLLTSLVVSSELDHYSAFKDVSITIIVLVVSSELGRYSAFKDVSITIIVLLRT